MVDLVVRNVLVEGYRTAVDIAVEEGRIVGISQVVPSRETDPDAEIIDGKGALLTPGFVESHIHLDKACILDRCRNETGMLEGAIASVVVAKKNFDRDDVYARGRKFIEKAIVEGTNAMRTHVEINPVIGLKGFEAVKQLKADYTWALDLQICVFPRDELTNLPGTRELLEQALDAGADLLGGCPYTDTDPAAQIRILFEMACRHDVDLDFHLDFDLDPTGGDLREVARQTVAFGWQGRVTIGHVTKLSAMPRAQLMDMAEVMKQAGVALTVLPATDLFLMGRDHDHLVPCGVSPAHVLHRHGVCCTVATNNVLNLFTPYGDCSLPRIANLYANVQQLSTQEELGACFAMVTSEPDRLIRRNARIEPGAPATFIELPAASGGQAVAEIARPLWGMKSGRMTFVRPEAELRFPGNPIARAPQA
ncbi:amidohydrolase family protein [Breoghania sp.]|uniref:amidohydrolase family protein n=1 Tax=Breoghania sp. TaxID=2065378 RepID=UPI002612702B|nr:amidohydrolase family protein [Breoghania sp.]MDJ0931712.1 amidohydrolase family protein [Breoghania sp.]